VLWNFPSNCQENCKKCLHGIVFCRTQHSNSWGHAVATQSRRRRGYGFNGKGGVGGARKYDGQLLTARSGGSWTSSSRCWDVELSTLELEKSDVLYIDVNKCISCIYTVVWLGWTLCDLLTARPNRYNNHAPTEPRVIIRQTYTLGSALLLTGPTVPTGSNCNHSIVRVCFDKSERREFSWLHAVNPVCVLFSCLHNSFCS